MALSPAFLPPRAFPLQRLPPFSTRTIRCPPRAKFHLPRRLFISLPLILLPLPLSRQAQARPQKPLSVSLAPLQNLQSTLSQLAEEVEQGTIGDIRRIVKTILIGADLPNNLRDAVQNLPKSEREPVLAKGREAFEYLNQVVEYYDPVDVKRKPGGELMVFCLNAVKRAEGLLAEVLEAFEGAAG